MNYKYFFITGAHKSGTSWLANLIRAHRAVAMPHHELWLFGHKDSIAGPGFDRLFSDWLQLRCVANEAREMPLAAIAPELRRCLVSGVLERYAKKKTEALGSKTPLYYALAHKLIHETFPESIFIEIIRDPRDVIVSHHFHRLRTRNFSHYGSAVDGEAAYAFHIEGSGDHVSLLHPGFVRKLAEQWVEVAEACRAASLLFGARFVSVRYEDLLNGPEPDLQRIFRTMGLKTTRAELQRIIEQNAFEKRSGGRRPGEHDPKKFYRKGVAGDWINYFDDEARRSVETTAGAMMAALDYGQDFEVAQQPAPDRSSPRSTGLLGRLGIGRWLRDGSGART
jgi:hypothetical protein